MKNLKVEYQPGFETITKSIGIKDERFEELSDMAQKEFESGFIDKEGSLSKAMCQLSEKAETPAELMFLIYAIAMAFQRAEDDPIFALGAMLSAQKSKGKEDTAESPEDEAKFNEFLAGMPKDHTLEEILKYKN